MSTLHFNNDQKITAPVQQDRKHPRVLKFGDMPQDQVIIIIIMEILLIIIVILSNAKFRLLFSLCSMGSTTERVVKHWNECPGSGEMFRKGLYLAIGAVFWRCGAGQLQVGLNLRHTNDSVIV